MAPATPMKKSPVIQNSIIKWATVVAEATLPQRKNTITTSMLFMVPV
ncbi:hypothetical protein [Flavobacterium cellulosilyticum]|nr:hypothetical protein [Flavobacterium cellulosilyticum]